jgi:biopolymer transport protein ExbB
MPHVPLAARWATRLLTLMLLACSPLALAEPDAPADPPAAEELAAEAEAPVDADLDEAADADDAEVGVATSFFNTLRQGGPTMYFLLALSVFGFAYAIERFVNLRRANVVPAGLAGDADRLWRAGKHAELAQTAEASNSTLGDVLTAVVRHRHASPGDLNTIAGDIASRDLKRHLQKAYPLAVVATLAPLLGLLGTIVGMIGAFRSVMLMGSMGDASILAGDISEALITTGTGLSIAVPALALYHFFKSRVGMFGILLEEDVSELLADWFVQHRSPEAHDAAAASVTAAPDTTAAPTAAVTAAPSTSTTVQGTTHAG